MRRDTRGSSGNMDFISNGTEQNEQMLKAIGVDLLADLFSAIPKELRCPFPASDDGLSEGEGLHLLEGLAARNSAQQFESYLGAGAYEHHVPAMVGPICQKSEFLTAYTPYQPEASQGMLQAIFEFQSAVCALTGMDVSNASVYDAASACAEALLMALRLRKRAKRVLVSSTLHPHYRAAVEIYLRRVDVSIEVVDDWNAATLDDGVAGVLVQSPNIYGVVEDLAPLFARAHEKGVITVHCGNPLAYGLYACPGELGADIAVGDMQPFGVGLQYGGPYVGYMACRQELVRQMPGRIVGETVDSEGRPGFVLTLQPREQHIRREKATSNICSNQALAALASLVATVWYGKEGVPALARTNFQRTMYLRSEMAKISGIDVDTSLPIFNEFVAKFETPIDEVLAGFRAHKIEPGVSLGRLFPGEEGLLICATETKTRAQLDRFLEVATEVAGVNAVSL